MIKEKILDAVQHPQKVGVNFLARYLYEHEDNSSQSSFKPKLLDTFLRNVKNIPSLPQTEETWNKIIETGDVKHAIVSAFDWDLAPEGYDFWVEEDKKFQATYKKAVVDGLNCNSIIPKVITQKTLPYEKENVSVNNPLYKGDSMYKNIAVSPSPITLRMIGALSPSVIHAKNPQVDIFNKILDDNGCSREFYVNLRSKPKHQGYETEFKKFCEFGDLRTIVYWAFNWAATQEGFDFWSNINAKVHSGITNELLCGKVDYKFNPFNMQVEKLHNDPISHATQLMLQDTKSSQENKNAITVISSNGIKTQQSTMRQKHETEGFCSKKNYGTCGYPHYGYSRYDFFDDYGGYEDYDDYYDDYYGGCCYAYTSKPTIPKDITSMPVNNNYIEVKADVTVIAER